MCFRFRDSLALVGVSGVLIFFPWIISLLHLVMNALILSIISLSGVDATAFGA